MSNLPYVFDLLFDIKTLADVERAVRGEHRTDVTPQELLEVFKENDLDIPECLLGVEKLNPPLTRVSNVTKNVYYCQGHKVLLVSKCGDNFGYVRKIETGEEFTTYGYNNLPLVGRIEIKVVETFGKYKQVTAE